MTLTPGQRLFCAPKDLSLHHLTQHQPWMSPERFALFAERVREAGVKEELLITPQHEIADGRHRWKSFSVRPWLSQECLPCRVVAEEEVGQIVLETTLGRRHLSKSARAYMALDLIGEAVRLAEEARISKLKQGKSPSADLSAHGEKGSGRPAGSAGSDRPSGLADQVDPRKQQTPLGRLATMLGISTDLLTLARKTEDLFLRADKLREKWLTEHPTEAESWDLREAEATPHWQAFRTQYLTEHGFTGDLESPASHVLIPLDFRAIYTGRLFSEADPDDDSGPMSLGAINKAMGSVLATLGKPRPDLDPENKAPHLQAVMKLTSFSKTMFGPNLWGLLSAEHRIRVAGEIAQSATAWPDEVRLAVLSQLKAAASKRVVLLEP